MSTNREGMPKGGPERTDSIKIQITGSENCTVLTSKEGAAFSQQISQNPDIPLLCGDLVHSGQLEKATALAKELGD
ncbi:MAG TPA: hypothetical protein VE170_09245 [Candidatus Limnocylindria bacterium]|nr:hypothetical protein [Candidatus Limnocylindria bacterium]